MVIYTPFARPYGELCQEEPEIDPYPVFVLETRVFPYIARHHPRLVPFFSTRNIDDEMRMVLNLDWEGFPATITPQEEARIQEQIDQVVLHYPGYAELIRQDELPEGKTLKGLKTQFKEDYEVIIYGESLLINLSPYVDDYRRRFQEIVNQIWDVEIPNDMEYDL